MSTKQFLEIKLKDSADTKRLGFELARCVDKHAVVALNGPLGAGKTTFAQGVGEALNVQEVISSPTFTMIHEYMSGRIPLYHLDLYRLQEAGTAGGDTNEADSNWLQSELDELQGAPGLILIEWANLFAAYIEQLDHILLELNYSTLDDGGNLEPTSHQENGRIARIVGNGSNSTEIVDALRNVYFS